MATLSQPAAGTSLPSTTLTSGLVFARNEADTTASTLIAGTATLPYSGGVYGTDADGRYLSYGSPKKLWTNLATYGPAWTMLVIAKRVNNGAVQMLAAFDPNTPRVYQLAQTETGGVTAALFNNDNSYVGTTTATTQAVSTSKPSAVILRIRDNSGYKGSVHVDGVAGAELAFTGTPNTTTSLEQLSREGGSTYVGNVYFTAIWSRALTDAEMAVLGANPWAVFDEVSSGGTTHAASGALASQSASVAGTSARAGSHAASGALEATSATIVGASARSGSFVTHGASGSLVAASTSVSGSASRSVASVTHATTGAAVSSSAALIATASRSAAGQLITDIIANNTMTPLANTAVVWSWLPIGRIGSLAAITPIDGTGTTGSDGRLTVSGLTAGAGILLVAKQNSGATDDDVFYQAGTVA